MLYPIYSIKDDLVGFGVPFSADNDAVAMRFFHQATVQPNSIYALNKSQFNLYKLGEFDTSSGDIVPCSPVYVCSANDFKGEDEL